MTKSFCPHQQSVVSLDLSSTNKAFKTPHDSSFQQCLVDIFQHRGCSSLIFNTSSSVWHAWIVVAQFEVMQHYIQIVSNFLGRSITKLIQLVIPHQYLAVALILECNVKLHLVTFHPKLYVFYPLLNDGSLNEKT
ncbi:hypothetical protein Tco_0537915 [Tanacetum coccineum]